VKIIFYFRVILTSNGKASLTIFAILLVILRSWFCFN